MMKSANVQKTVFVFASALALSGCATSPPTQIFTLDAAIPSPATVAAYVSAPIRVESVQIPPSLNRAELVRQTGPDLLKIEDFAHWSAPLGQLARNALTQDLASRLSAGAVIYPDAASPSNVRGLSVNILAFTASADTAFLDVSWTLTADQHEVDAPVLRPHAAVGAPNGTPLGPPLLRRTLRLSVPVSGASPQDQAEALSQLLGQLAESVLKNVTSE